jgi:hypothetical protein
MSKCVIKLKMQIDTDGLSWSRFCDMTKSAIPKGWRAAGLAAFEPRDLARLSAKPRAKGGLARLENLDF